MTATERDAIIIDFMPMVHWIANKLSCAYPSVDVADLVQDGVIGLINAADTYDSSKKMLFRNYAYSKIYWSIIDEQRKHFGKVTATRKGKPIPVSLDSPISPNEDVDILIRDTLVAEDNVEEEAIATVMNKTVRDCVERLRPQEKTVIKSVYLEGKEQKDVGPVLGVHSTRVSQIKTEGLKNLRKMMKAA